jgi:hypothetical protein
MTSNALRRSILCVSFFVAVFALAAAGRTASPGEQDAAAVAPSHQVIACYFHRTVRCPTCKRIGGYIEESVAAGFAPQIQEGSVKVTMVDFQDPKNAAYTQAYKITGPTLVIMDVRDGKVAVWKTAPKVWSLVGQKDQFFSYVQGEIRAYSEGATTAAR